MCNITAIRNADEKLISTIDDNLYKDIIKAAILAGRHSAANGIFWCDAYNQIGYYKLGERGDVLYNHLYGEEKNQNVNFPEVVKWVVVHNRVPTSSSANDNQNNHPFNIPPIIGCHMGFVRYVKPYRNVFEKIDDKEMRVKTDSAQFLAIVSDIIAQNKEMYFDQFKQKIMNKLIKHSIEPHGMFIFSTYDDPAKLYRIDIGYGRADHNNVLEISEVAGVVSNILRFTQDA